MTLDDGRDKGAQTDDSVSRVVAKPRQGGDDQFCSCTRVAQGRQNFGVKQSRDAVANLKIDPADGYAVAKPNDSFVRNLNVHSSLVFDCVRRH